MLPRMPQVDRPFHMARCHANPNRIVRAPAAHGGQGHGHTDPPQNANAPLPAKPVQVAEAAPSGSAAQGAFAEADARPLAVNRFRSCPHSIKRLHGMCKGASRYSGSGRSASPMQRALECAAPPAEAVIQPPRAADQYEPSRLQGGRFKSDKRTVSTRSLECCTPESDASSTFKRQPSSADSLVSTERDSHDLFVAESPEPTYQVEREIVAALSNHGRRMHIVRVGRTGQPPVVLKLTERGVDVSSDALNVPAGTTAVLLLSEAPSSSDCVSAIGSMKEALGQSAAPVIVLLLRHKSGLVAEPEVLLQEGKMLAQGGASDVIIQPSSLDELVSTLALRAAFIAEHRLRLAQTREQLRLTKEAAGRYRAQSQMFWQNVHLIHQGFAKMNPKATGQPQEGLRISGRVLGDCIGSGAFGRVFAATHEATGRSEAMKVVPKSKVSTPAMVQSLLTECMWLGRLQHPNIVPAHGWVHGQDHIYISMGRAGDHSLMRALQGQGPRMTVPAAQTIFRQMVSAIVYCHAEFVAHRDLKPENIMLSEDHGQAVLVDFGLSASLEDGPLIDACGSMPFVAPEVLRGDAYDGAQADVWSLGVVLLETLCGVHALSRLMGWGRQAAPTPERSEELDALFADGPNKLEAHMSSTMDGAPSAVLLRLVSEMMTMDPALRCTAMGAEDMAAEDWSTDCKVEEDETRASTE